VALSTKRPTKETAKAVAKIGTAEKRIVADVPEHIHRQVRLRCLERGILVRDYVLELLARDGVK
jgi:hypothetical protein